MNHLSVSLSKFIASASLIALAFTGASAQDASITIDAGKTGPRLSPLQHGIFFEEINHAGEGGLYAEKIANRNFGDRFHQWEGCALVQGHSNISTETNGAGLKVKTVFSRSPGSAGVKTNGYWGIGVVQGQKYNARSAAEKFGTFRNFLRNLGQSCRIYQRR